MCHFYLIGYHIKDRSYTVVTKFQLCHNLNHSSIIKYDEWLSAVSIKSENNTTRSSKPSTSSDDTKSNKTLCYTHRCSR